MARESQGERLRERSTFTLDPLVKRKFTIACTTLGMNMSEVVEAMMINFLDISERSIQVEKEKLYGTDAVVEVTFVESTRLEDGKQ